MFVYTYIQSQFRDYIQRTTFRDYMRAEADIQRTVSFHNFKSLGGYSISNYEITLDVVIVANYRLRVGGGLHSENHIAVFTSNDNREFPSNRNLEYVLVIIIYLPRGRRPTFREPHRDMSLYLSIYLSLSLYIYIYMYIYLYIYIYIYISI